MALHEVENSMDKSTIKPHKTSIQGSSGYQVPLINQRLIDHKNEISGMTQIKLITWKNYISFVKRRKWDYIV